MFVVNQKLDHTKVLDNLEMIHSIKRSELIKMANAMDISCNDYISQIVRTYPEIQIINDMSFKESIDNV